MKIFETNAEVYDFTTWQVMEEYLPKKLLSEYRKAFNSYDEHKKGLIEIEDVTKILSRKGRHIPVSEVQELLQKLVGIDNRQTSFKFVDFTEYIAIVSLFVTNCIPEDEMYRVFRQFDLDGDGFISPEELRDLLSRVGDEITDRELEEMMREADRDGDGKVSYKEFIRVMTNSVETDQTLPYNEVYCMLSRQNSHACNKLDGTFHRGCDTSQVIEFGGCSIEEDSGTEKSMCCAQGDTGCSGNAKQCSNLSKAVFNSRKILNKLTNPRLNTELLRNAFHRNKKQHE